MNDQEQALSMTDVKLKLANLKKYMPNAHEVICQFGSYLGENLNDELVPMGFAFGTQLALIDLQSGINGFTNEKIKHPLVGYPAMVFGIINLSIPNIVDAVLPVDFATEVKKIISEAQK